MTNADSDRSAAADDEIAFTAAMAELNSIVTELESDMLDVDVLAERVERAAHLVKLCRNRLDATKLRVEEVIVRLDPGLSDPVEEPDDDQPQ